MPERRPPDDPSASEWLNRARSNLERAKADIRLSGVYLEDLCFDAQQAAEKAIKAVLIHTGIRFPYIHDLGALLNLLERSGATVPSSTKEAARLTRFAIATRYPGVTEPVTREEYDKAIAIADAIVRWANEQIQRKR